MSDSWLGEIRLYPYTRLPAGWHLCDGTMLQIRANQALFALISNRYGGDGSTTFALPDLRGRVPVHVNPTDASCNVPGKTGGAEGVALTAPQIPPHSHLVSAFDAVGTVPNPLSNFPAAVAATSPQVYVQPTSPASLTPLNPASLAPAGTATAHENRQPTMALNWCICISGSFPSRN